MGDSEKLITRFWDAISNKDFDAATNCLGDDFVERWPQSGEVIRGRENWRAMVTNHPAFPNTTVERHEGRDDLWVSHVVFDYPRADGFDRYYVGSIQVVEGGKIVDITEYFAAPFEIPEWRKPWVEMDSTTNPAGASKGK